MGWYRDFKKGRFATQHFPAKFVWVSVQRRWGRKVNPACEGSKLFRYGILGFVPIALSIVPALSWFSTEHQFSLIRLFASLPCPHQRIDPLVSNFSLP
jgi:hypothetical protein